MLTQQDYNDYGSDLINVTQRAALHAVGPHLQNLEQQNAALAQRLAHEARFRLDQQVERSIPNFREIDRDPNWHRWLVQSDPLSGVPRQQLLNRAIADSDASRAISFFKQFLQQNQATGQPASPTYGRARSASGPIYTRDQIARLYRQHQQGAYRGREVGPARRGYHCCEQGGSDRWRG